MGLVYKQTNLSTCTAHSVVINSVPIWTATVILEQHILLNRRDDHTALIKLVWWFCRQFSACTKIVKLAQTLAHGRWCQCLTSLDHSMVTVLYFALREKLQVLYERFTSIVRIYKYCISSNLAAARFYFKAQFWCSDNSRVARFKGSVYRDWHARMFMVSVINLFVCMYYARVHTYIAADILPYGEISRAAFIGTSG